MKHRRPKSRPPWWKKQLLEAWECIRKNDKFYSFIFIVAQEIVRHYIT